MEFILLRILKGRLSYRRDDLSLYIVEPNQDLMYESIEIYEDAYDKAYGSGVYLKQEIEEYMAINDMWSPFDQMDIEKIKKENEELKLQAYKNFYKKRELTGIKYLLKQNDTKMLKILSKKNQFDHLTCEGVASYSRWNWIIEHSTFYKDGTRYDWQDFGVSTMMTYYENSSISSSDFRSVARSENWRPVWGLGKKTGDLFGVPTNMLTKDQIFLCSYSSMYDNVYENSEAPDDAVIEDDDCLDGWFIDQRRKNDKLKKEQRVNSMLTNSKIANAGEVFLVASSPEDVDAIHSMNTYQSDMIRKSRLEEINQKGIIKNDTEFSDVRRDLQMQQNQALANHLKGK